uniref:Uncharacterized protein n=1 Tax=Plectus sambesii TaxID=2011161 RepID=A0A914WKZ5_9BILA
MNRESEQGGKADRIRDARSDDGGREKPFVGKRGVCATKDGAGRQALRAIKSPLTEYADERLEPQSHARSLSLKRAQFAAHFSFSQLPVAHKNIFTINEAPALQLEMKQENLDDSPCQLVCLDRSIRNTCTLSHMLPHRATNLTGAVYGSISLSSMQVVN